jgi:predicted ATPase/DNA-binding XRE family transcriptional regulator
MSIQRTPGTFGAWVKTRRRQLDLSQAGLGERAGCSAAMVRKIEADLRKPSRQLAEILARVLEIPTAEQIVFLQMARGKLLDQAPVGSEPSTMPAHNLPVLLTSTINRSRDLQAVLDLFAQESVHLVTLLGPPGIGKTRLSIASARQMLPAFPDGVWFADLASIERAEYFVPSMARSIETIQLPPSPGLSQFTQAVKDKHVLLVLDNLEHIIEGAAREVAHLLQTCEQVRVLATSRTPLHIYGEHEYPLPPLSIPPLGAAQTAEDLPRYESVQLLTARVRQHQPAFKVTNENAAAIVKICTVLEGIPLALELAAASLRRMTLEQMAALLNGVDGTGWLNQLSTPARDLPARQRTLENLVAWSYTRLEPALADLFRKLAIFPGSFDAEAASAVCLETPCSPAATLELLNALGDQSLLAQGEILGQPTWRMLEFIREYAGQQLDPATRQELERQFIRHYLERLENIQQEPDRHNQEIFYEANAANLHTALQYAIRQGNVELGFELAQALEPLWDQYGYGREGLALAKALLALPDDSPPQVRTDRLQKVSDLAWQYSDYESSLAYARESAELARTNGLRSRYPLYLNRLGRILIQQERLLEARQALEESYRLAQADPGILNPGSPLAQLGEVALFEGRLEDARRLFDEALRWLSPEEAIFLAMTYTDLAEIALIQLDYAQARSWLQQAAPYIDVHIRRVLAYLCAAADAILQAPASTQTAAYTAACLISATQALSERSGVALVEYFRQTLARRGESARRRLGDAAYREAVEAGQSLRKAEALELVANFFATDER